MTIAEADGKCVEQQPHLRAFQDLVGDQLVGRHVVRLGLDAPAEQAVRRAERIDRLKARKHIVGNAMHHLAMLAVHLGVQAAEIGEAGRGAGAAEETVALHQDRRAPGSARRCRSGDAGGPAAQHDDLVLGEEFGLAFRLGDEH